MVTGQGSISDTLSDERVQEILAQALEPMAFDGPRWHTHSAHPAAV